MLAVTDPDTLERARGVVEQGLDAVDQACSRFRSDAELVHVNASAGAITPVSALLFEALRAAFGAARSTSGLVDPTIGKALRLSGYDDTFSIVRTRHGRLVRASSVLGPDWRSVELDDASRTVRLPLGVELDLGATAKALAADRCALAASEAIGSGVLLSLGGDIAIAGAAPAGGWPIRVADDNSAPLDGPGPTVAVATGAIATSGTTVRRWTTATRETHHIIDPRTGRAAVSPWRTVTVAAATCVDANTASTAAIVLGDAAPSWLAARSLPARLVHNDGTASLVAGWPGETE